MGSKVGEQRSLSKNQKSNKMEHKKKIVFESIMTNKQEDMENIPYLNNFRTQTMRTEDLHFGSMELKGRQTQKIHFREPPNLTHQKALALLAKTWRFLANNHEDLEGQIAFQEVLQKIVECGEEFDVELRDKREDSMQF